jgi:hypothetical protein
VVILTVTNMSTSRAFLTTQIIFLQTAPVRKLTCQYLHEISSDRCQVPVGLGTNGTI